MGEILSVFLDFDVVSNLFEKCGWVGRERVADESL